jgi:hypothetical protein
LRNQLSSGAALACCLIACAVSAKAQHAGSYDWSRQNIVQVDYKSQSEELFGQIKSLYFAIGCKVVPNEVSLTPYIHSLSQAFEARAHESGVHPNETSRMKQAATEGIAKAKEAGACGFWHQHPEMVKEIRRIAVSGP